MNRLRSNGGEEGGANGATAHQMFPDVTRPSRAALVYPLRRRAASRSNATNDAGEAVKETSILVLSTDPLGAALLGALVETVGYQTLFARANEGPRDTVLRLRPRIVLVDCEYADACNDAFLGPARMLGAGVLVYAAQRRADQLRAVVERHDVATFTLPIAAAELAKLLAEAIRS